MRLLLAFASGVVLALSVGKASRPCAMSMRWLVLILAVACAGCTAFVHQDGEDAAVSMTRSAESVQQTLDRNGVNETALALFSERLLINKTLRGEVVYALTIGADGSVEECRLLSSTMGNDPILVGGVANIVCTVDFGQIQSQEKQTYRIPLRFYPGREVN